MPFTNAAMAAHPAFRASLARLRDWGVTVLFGDDVSPAAPARHRRAVLHRFPWDAGVAALRSRRPAYPVADPPPRRPRTGRLGTALDAIRCAAGAVCAAGPDRSQPGGAVRSSRR